MAEGAAVDRAYDRYKILSTLIALELERARANPQDRRYLALGITEVGDTKSQAAQKTVAMFDSLARFVEHVAILDMTASFEYASRATIGNAAGGVRSLIKNNARGQRSNLLAARLVRNAADFKGWRDIFVLVKDRLSQQVIDAAELIQTSRNNFAHGTDLNIPPAIEPPQARDSLVEIASRLID